MKTASLIAAAGIVVIANAFALVHAARNRAGTPESEITLTERELGNSYRSSTDDDSGVALYLQWTESLENSGIWLDRAKLERIGFDCRVEPDISNSWRFYQRQGSRRAFVALEYNGASWRARFDACELQAAMLRARSPGHQSNCPDQNRLVAIDADLDPVQLRLRHPDRATVVILPAVIATSVGSGWDPVTGKRQGRPRVQGRILELPSAIHVPLPFSAEFRRRASPAYRVRLRFGASFEPWVTGVEFTGSH